MQSVVLILLSFACCALFVFMAACAYRLFSRWLRTPWMLRRLPSGPYHCHYACERDVMADSRARHMALICHYGYTNKQLADYYENLTIASLPMEKLLGWTRTIAEDLLEHPSPILRVDYWSDYIARLSGRLVVVHPHVDEFLPWETSYLWGRCTTGCGASLPASCQQGCWSTLPKWRVRAALRSPILTTSYRWPS